LENLSLPAEASPQVEFLIRPGIAGAQTVGIAEVAELEGGAKGDEMGEKFIIDVGLEQVPDVIPVRTRGPVDVQPVGEGEVSLLPA
jgi:hypothetical protein